MQVTYKALPNRRFGVEFEVSNNVTKKHLGLKLKQYEDTTTGRDVVTTPGLKGWAETNSNAYWHVKYDSTCGPLGKGKDSGWEIASFIGHGQRDLSHISKVAYFLSSIGAEVNSNCGFHVHIDVSDYSQSEMGVLLARWLKVEPVLMAICDETRRNNKYCKPLRNRWIWRSWRGYDPNFPADFCYNMMPTNLSTHDNEDKKVTLNIIGWSIGQFLPSYHRKTVELRLPEARLDFDHVFHWVSLFLSFVTISKLATAPIDLDQCLRLPEVLGTLGLHGDGREFFLFEKSLLATKLWFLNKLARSESSLAVDAGRLVEFISKI